MKRKVCRIMGCAVLAGSIMLPFAASAQERSTVASPRPASYDTRHETILEGTVLSYTGDSVLPPIGVHVTVQTSSGTVDAHLGPESYLRSNHFSLSPGDSVRFVGVSMLTSQGSVFLVRVAQKGDQSMVIRSSRGFLQGTTPARVLPRAQREQTAPEGKAR